MKRNEQNLQEIWDYVKRPNLCLIGVPAYDGENESKLENTLQDITQENFLNQTSWPTFKSRKYRKHHKDIPQEEQPKIFRFSTVEMKEKNPKGSQREGLGYPQKEAHQTHS